MSCMPYVGLLRVAQVMGSGVQTNLEGNFGEVPICASSFKCLTLIEPCCPLSISFHVPEQRWVLLPAHHDADLDGVHGQHGVEAGVGVGDPDRGGKGPLG